MPELRALQTGCFGKLPFTGDYVGINAGTGPAAAFKEWLLEGAALAKGRLEGEWRPRFDASSHYRFLFWQDQADTFLVGSFGPSRDQSGRRFPVAVFQVVSGASLGDQFPGIVGYFSGFFSRADEFISQAIPDRRAEGVRSLSELRSKVEGGLSGIPRTVEPDLDEVKVSDLIAALRWDRRPFETTLGNISDLSARTAGQPDRRPRFGIRFPLPEGGRLHSEVVSFWLQLGRIALGTGNDTPTVFWTSPSGASAGRLDLYFATPDPVSFLFLVATDLDAESIYPVHGEGGLPRADAPPWGLQELRNPELTLARVLRLIEESTSPT